MITFKQSPWVLFVKREKLTSSCTNLGQCVLHPPYFAFVTQTKLTNQLQFLVQSFLLKWTPWSRVRFLRVKRYAWHFVALSPPVKHYIKTNLLWPVQGWHNMPLQMLIYIQQETQLSLTNHVPHFCKCTDMADLTSIIKIWLKFRKLHWNFLGVGVKCGSAWSNTRKMQETVRVISCILHITRRVRPPNGGRLHEPPFYCAGRRRPAGWRRPLHAGIYQRRSCRIG